MTKIFITFLLIMFSGLVSASESYSFFSYFINQSSLFTKIVTSGFVFLALFLLVYFLINIKEFYEDVFKKMKI